MRKGEMLSKIFGVALVFVVIGSIVGEHKEIRPETIYSWAWDLLLGGASYCPVDLAITDPDGLVLNKQGSEIPGAIYEEIDIDEDGELDDLFAIPGRKTGDYLIQVIPEPNALPEDTYSLEAAVNGETIVLAEDVQISDIPSEPYVFNSIPGCYIGAYLGCGSDDLSCENISDFNQEMGKNHAIFVRYVDVADSENLSHFEWAQEIKDNGAMPMCIYDPWDGLDAINISDVGYFASECNELNTTVFIVFGHEMNGLWYPWGNAPDNYTSKFKEVAEIFHENAPNVEMCWVPNQNWGYPWGGTDYGDGYSEYYPEGTGTYGEYVDWVGLNFYEKDWDEDNLVPPDMFVANIRNGQDSADFYEMFAVGKNKPMLIAEMGAFDPNKDPTAPGERDPLNEAEQAEFKNEWLEQAYNVTTLQEEFPRLNAICYFHVSKTETIDTQSHSFYDITADYRIPESPNVYENLISDPYFIGAEANSPPNMPCGSSPANHATGVSTDVNLNWTGGDPDVGDTVNYTVYFGTSSPPPFRETIGPYAANQTSISYSSGTLSYNSTYYWQIAATDNHGASTVGPVREFTTQQATTLEGHVGFYRAEDPGDPTWETPLVVRFFDNATGIEAGWSPKYATTDAYGNFTTDSIEPGTYDIGIKNYTTHSKMVNGKVFTPGNTTAASFGTLVEADCDDSDKTDAADYSRVLNNYNVRKIADPTFWATYDLWKADYTRDEKIDASDFSAVLNNYGDRGDIFYYTH